MKKSKMIWKTILLLVVYVAARFWPLTWLLSLALAFWAGRSLGGPSCQ